MTLRAPSAPAPRRSPRLAAAGGLLALVAALGCGGGGGGNTSGAGGDGSGTSTHAISGALSGAVRTGVTVTLAGAGTGTLVTDPDGVYTFTALHDGSYTLTPSLVGYTFAPASRDVVVAGADVGAVNFVASAVVAGNRAISGWISGASGTTRLDLTGDRMATTTASAIGLWSFTALPDGHYTVTPSLAGYTFSPASVAVTVSGGDVGSQAFTAQFVARPVADTGQTTCTDTSGASVSCAGSGQDAEYSIHPRSFTDGGDGTVLDGVTGLLWQKQDDATGRTWFDARTYCDGLSLGGRTGWRLPAVTELIGLVDYGRHGPAVDGAFFPGTSTDAAGYWSSTLVPPTGAQAAAWIVAFYHGTWTKKGTSDSTVRVRCVLGPQLPPSSIYVDNGDGTVTDTATNLMWQKADDGVDRIWSVALPICPALSLGGHADWRAPTIAELASIVAFWRVQPTLDPALVGASAVYWSSTWIDASANSAFTVFFSDGISGTPIKGVPGPGGARIRCVRGQ